MSFGHGLARSAAAGAIFSLAFAGLIATSPLAMAATISQTSPTSGTTLASQSAAFTTTLTASGTGPVTFTTSTPGFTIAGSELESTGPLAASGTPYLITGADSDTSSDSGSWTFSLLVTPDTIIQTSPSPASVDVAASATFTTTLTAASGFVGPVTFTTATAGFTVTTGDVLSTTETLSVAGSPYTVSGNDTDAYGDTGSWTYALVVTPDVIIQGLPLSSVTTSSGSSSFATTLTATSGFIGPVTFTTATSNFTISGGDELESTGALAQSGSPYIITGSDSDLYGDSGTWSFHLTVLAPSATSSVLVQTSATAGTVVTTSSAQFTAGPITVAHNVGAVNFVTTASNPNVVVSPLGEISTLGQLPEGTYQVSGTDSDVAGDSGTWIYTLTVTAPVVTVTFEANGGSGVMAPQSESGPSALRFNVFTRRAHTFLDWNTAANGSGTTYANGTVFSFSAPTELFAQWKAGKVPSRMITFEANGGKGSPTSEIDNTPTAIAGNRFERTGYKFVTWNTAANGSGRVYKAGATYAFKKSVVLFAQWKKVAVAVVVALTHVVTFVANGGVGTMAPEHHHATASLTANRFTRTHFIFIGWSTNANGSGSSYANDSLFPFTSSVTLYARWRKDKVTVIAPPIGPKRTGIPVGPFARGTSSLTSALQSEVDDLASAIGTDKKTQITLYGYGDMLTTENEHDESFLAANIALGRMRAQAVATYLEGRLSALGLKGWTISIEATSLAAPNSNNADAATVFASLS